MHALASTPSVAAEILERIVPALEVFVRHRTLAGAAALMWRGAQLVHYCAVGWSDLEHRTPVGPDTLFRVASMTKPITTVAALTLVEEGRLALHDPITRWAPEFAEMRVLARCDGPLDETVRAQRPITVLDLLTHRAGLCYGFLASGPVARAYEEQLGSPFASSLDPDEWLRRLARLPLLHQPGERFTYGHSTDLLGLLLARICGRPLRDVVRARVFQPLGMHDADFYVDPQALGRVARVYGYDGERRALARVPWLAEPLPSSFVSAGQGALLTVRDFLRFARMLLDKGALDGVRILAESSIELMTRDWLGAAGPAVDLLGMPLGGGIGLGLGVCVVTDPARTLADGAQGAFGWPSVLGSWWQVDPARGLILVYFTGLTALSATGQLATSPGMRAPQVFRQLAYTAARALDIEERTTTRKR